MASARAAMGLDVERAWEAFQNLDRAGFQAAHARVMAGVPCLAEPLTSAEAAAIHGLEALAAFLARDDAATVAALRAALAADPGFEIARAGLSESHPLYLHLKVARGMGPGRDRPLEVPTGEAYLLDGTSAAALPMERPAVLQRVGPGGDVQETVLLQPGGEPPSWVVWDADLRRPWGWVAAAGTAAAAAGACWVVAGGREAVLLDPTTPYEDLPGLRRQADGLTGAATVLGLSAVGLGVVVVVRW